METPEQDKTGRYDRNHISGHEEQMRMEEAEREAELAGDVQPCPMPEEREKHFSLPVLLILLGILVLLIDIRITTQISYPEYVMLEEYGTTIQQMVMGDAVGNYVRLDVVSDLVGFVLVIAGSLLLMKDAKAYRNGKQFGRAVAAGILGFLFYLVRLFMPYLLHGAILYGGEYGIHFAVAAAESFAAFYAVSGIVALCERAESHWGAVICEIFMVLAAICGYICGMGAFYRIMYVKWIYYLAQCILTGLAGLMLLRMKRYWMQGYRKDEIL